MCNQVILSANKNLTKYISIYKLFINLLIFVSIYVYDVHKYKNINANYKNIENIYNKIYIKSSNKEV